MTMTMIVLLTYCVVWVLYRWVRRRSDRGVHAALSAELQNKWQVLPKILPWWRFIALLCMRVRLASLDTAAAIRFVYSFIFSYPRLSDTRIYLLNLLTLITTRGAGDHEGQGAASYLRAISGVVARGTLSPKFWAVGKSSFCQKFFVEKCKRWSWFELLFWGNLGSNLKFWAPMVSSVGHLQLSVIETQWEIFSVRRKTANSCPA